MKRTFLIVLPAIAITLFSGCARQPIVSDPNKCTVKNQIFANGNNINVVIKKKTALKAYQLRVKPIVGSQIDDSRVVVDMGVVQKIWIAPYKDRNNLIAAHDIYSWMRRPDFIPGESLPKYYKKASGMVTIDKKYPYVFRPEELDNVKNDFSNETIKKFVNHVYKEANDESIIDKRIMKAGYYDKKIKEFISK